MFAGGSKHPIWFVNKKSQCVQSGLLSVFFLGPIFLHIAVNDNDKSFQRRNT